MVLMGQPNEETQQIDNPIVVNNVLSFLIYGTTKAEVPGSTASRAISGPLIAAALLRLPHHGWPRNLLRRAHGRCGVFAVARKTVHHALDSLAAAAQLSISLHRQHRWLDDRRDRPPALARLRAHAHRARAIPTNVSAGNGLFTLIGFMGLYAVLVAALHRAGLPRNQPGPNCHVSVNVAAG